MATWAKGVDFKNSANTARVGGVGIYGTDGSAQKAYLGIGTEPWNKTGLEVTSSEVSFKGNKVYHAGSKPTPAEIGAAASNHTHNYAATSHNHGLLHDNFGATIENTTTDNGWSMINSSYNGFLLKSIRSNASAPAWLQNNYAAGIAFGGADTKGVMSVAYGSPSVRFAGGNGSKPVWYFTVNGSSGKTYNMDSLAANTANTLATARTINGTSFNGSANITTANWGTARNIQIGNTAKSVNGSGNVSWSLSEIGALSTSGKAADSSKLNGLTHTAFGRAYSASYAFGGNQNAITTAQFVTMLTDLGAFSQPYWIARGSWSYASNQYINDTGCGNIHLAGCTVEVMGTSSAYTIRITTPTTSSSGVTNGDFIYVNNGSDYSPGWRRLYNTAYKPTASEIGAAAASHNHSNMLTFKSNHTTDWTSASSMSGKTYMGGWHGTLTSGTTGYVSLGANGSNTLDLMIDGDIYVRENSKVYHSGNKPTPSDIGAAASNHTHNYVPTSAGGNITVHADSDSSTTTEYLALKAGHNILQITSSGGGSTTTQGQDKLTFNGNIVYHAGRKPTISEIGAAASSHTHNIINTQGDMAPQTGRTATAGLRTYGYYNNGGPTSYGEVISFGNGSGGHAEIAVSWSGTPDVHVRSLRDTTDNWTSWYKIYHSGNKPTPADIGAAAASHTHNYAGSSSAGGNANAAVKLATARTINGTNFDGTANITTANWGTARNIQIGNTSKSVNGSANVTWSLSEIGALSLSGGTLTGLLSTPNNQMGIKLGDDALIGDGNVANNMVLQGVQDSTLGGITFGSGKDTNIYRGGANLLKTDDTMNAVGGFQWNGQSLDERYFARRGEIGKTTNWNSIVHPGCYKVQQDSWGNAESTHAPCQGYSYGLLMVYRTNVSGEDRLYQVYMPHRADEPRWYRMCNSGSWQEWKAQDVRDSADRRYVKGDNIKLSVEGDILNSSALTTSRKQLIAGSADKVYAGNTSANLILESSSTPQVRINNNFYPIYHTGNKPTASEIGAAASNHTHSYLPLSGGTMTGAITVSGESRFHNGTYTDPWNGTGCAIKASGHVAVGGQIKATSTITAPTFAGALSGNATTATKLQTARTIALGGILSGSASFDGSGNVTINATANDITTITKSLNVTTSWADTGITGSNLGTGTYAVQMYINDGANTNQWTEYYSGIMSWFNGTTNSTDADEILLHKAGHASNGRHLYLRTIRTSNSGYLKLQISCTHAFSAASSITFKFKKLI